MNARKGGGFFRVELPWESLVESLDEGDGIAAVDFSLRPLFVVAEGLLLEVPVSLLEDFLPEEYVFLAFRAQRAADLMGKLRGEDVRTLVWMHTAEDEILGDLIVFGLLLNRRVCLLR